jgi:signal transduction histidine kinase
MVPDPPAASAGSSETSLRFHGIFVTTPETRNVLRESFYGLSIVIVIGVTFLGAFLLWRDARREARMSELRSQFVSSVSHELKTPLTAIRMFAETLQMRGKADPQTHAEYLGAIVNESERLSP